MHRNVCFDLDLHSAEAAAGSPVDEGVVDHLLLSPMEDQSSSQKTSLEALEMEGLSTGGRAGDPKDMRKKPSSQGCQSGQGRHGKRQNESGWSRATLEVLSSMPSRTISRSQSAIFSFYFNRLHIRRHRQSLSTTRNLSCSFQINRNAGPDSEQEERERLAINLQRLSTGDRVRLLRKMPLSLAEKCKLRKGTGNQRCTQSISVSNMSLCSSIKYYSVMAVQVIWYSWLSFLKSLHLWQGVQKNVSGRFGTGVLSYFIFLKTLLLYNTVLVLISGIFLAGPQTVLAPMRTSTSARFTGKELLTGMGYFTDSVMFYGYYTNSVLSCQSTFGGCGSGGSYLASSYNIPLAYFTTTGIAFFVTCLFLVYSVSRSSCWNSATCKSQHSVATKVFCCWDFKIFKKTSVRLQSENICMQLKELQPKDTCNNTGAGVLKTLLRKGLHMLVWVMFMGSAVACLVFVHNFSEPTMVIHKDEDLPKDWATLMVVPITVSVVSMLLPIFFSILAYLEWYDSPSWCTYVTIFRNLLLKVMMLGLLCYYWLGKVAKSPKSLGLQCWESFVGQELYRLLMMDFLLTVVKTLFGEFLWRLITQGLLRRKPEFDIPQNMLELIYGQTLIWLGLLFSPLLPAAQIVKLLMIFYIKKASLMRNYQVSQTPWKDKKMTSFFLSVLCFPFFSGALVYVIYAMSTLKPSGACGPFRNLVTMSQSLNQWIERLKITNPGLSWAYMYLVKKPLFLFSSIFLVIIYFHTQIVDGQRKIISLLEEQIENEGKDKKFLICKIQALHKQTRPHPACSGRCRSGKDAVDDI